MMPTERPRVGDDGVWLSVEPIWTDEALYALAVIALPLVETRISAATSPSETSPVADETTPPFELMRRRRWLVPYPVLRQFVEYWS
jgi:hypothetical protein